MFSFVFFPCLLSFFLRVFFLVSVVSAVFIVLSFAFVVALFFVFYVFSFPIVFFSLKMAKLLFSL